MIEVNKDVLALSYFYRWELRIIHCMLFVFKFGSL
jgi:hypothetical protein